MKKLAIVLTLVLVLAAAVTAFAACKNDYDLIYDCWNLGTDAEPTVEEYMIQAFEEAHNVRIMRRNHPGSSYGDAIKSTIGRGEAPDVFMIDSINYVLSNQYGLDITEYAANDEDWKNIPAALEESAHYKSGIYAVPFAMHMEGFFVNVDLLKKNNVTSPTKGSSLPYPTKASDFTYEWFKEAISKVTMADPATNQKAKGLLSESEFMDWYPSAVNSDYGMFTWDGSKYNLDSPEFAEALAQTADIRAKGYSYDSLSAEERQADFGGVDPVDAFNQGKVAFRYGKSYEAPDMFQKSGGNFEIVFLGIPYVQNSTSDHKRTESFSIMIPDYTAVYKETKNPELAFEFAKWMGYSPEGIQKRIELAQDAKDLANQVPNTLPMTTDESAIEKYFAIYPVKGVEKMYENLDKLIMEPTKVVPGYTGSRWNAVTKLEIKVMEDNELKTKQNAKIGEFLDACWNGYGDVDFTPERAASCNNLANQQYANMVAKYEELYH